MVADAAGQAAMERWFMHPLRGQRYFPRLVGVLDAAAARALVHGLADKRLRTPHEALAVSEALAAGIETTVNDVHRPVIPSSP